MHVVGSVRVSVSIYTIMTISLQRISIVQNWISDIDRWTVHTLDVIEHRVSDRHPETLALPISMQDPFNLVLHAIGILAERVQDGM